MITLEQALFQRPDGAVPHLRARSPGFTDAWLPEAQRLILGFGERTHARPCPLTVFAMPIASQWVAVVRVSDDPAGSALRFHFSAIERHAYERWVRDPFMLAARVEPTWEASEALPTLSLPVETFAPRTVAQVQSVLKRVKAAALKEGEDPEAPDFDRTIENSESPALLGGAQILVDGGRLIFERPRGDVPLVSGLWLLLPEATRSRLWPTTFAFSGDLDFDVLVVPRLNAELLEGYTTEEQAADYPDGVYELALQRAAEAGNQEELDAVFSRRDSRQTVRLALVLLAVLSFAVLLLRWPAGEEPRSSNPLTPRQQQAAAAAGIVAVSDPLTATSMIAFGKAIWKKERPDGRK